MPTPEEEAEAKRRAFEDETRGIVQRPRSSPHMPVPGWRVNRNVSPQSLTEAQLSYINKRPKFEGD